MDILDDIALKMEERGKPLWGFEVLGYLARIHGRAKLLGPAFDWAAVV